MKVKEYFETVIDAVSMQTDLRRGLILGSRTREAVDARWMVVRLMRDAGFYSTQIAPLVGLSVRTVQIILISFDNRIKYSADSMLRNNYETITKQLRSN